MTTRQAFIAAAAALTTFLSAAPQASANAGERSVSRAHRHDLDAVRAATRDFRDLAVAVTAGGYSTEVVDLAGIACIADPESTGGMGVHYVNAGLLTDGEIDALRPEAMIYEPQSDGGSRLVAVEYLVLRTSWEQNHKRAPKLFGQEFELVPAGNRYGLPDFYELHAWIWRANLKGTFEDWNPQVSCA